MTSAGISTRPHSSSHTGAPRRPSLPPIPSLVYGAAVQDHLGFLALVGVHGPQARPGQVGEPARQALGLGGEHLGVTRPGGALAARLDPVATGTLCHAEDAVGEEA